MLSDLLKNMIATNTRVCHTYVRHLMGIDKSCTLDYLEKAVANIFLTSEVRRKLRVYYSYKGDSELFTQPEHSYLASRYDPTWIYSDDPEQHRIGDMDEMLLAKMRLLYGQPEVYVRPTYATPMLLTVVEVLDCIAPNHEFEPTVYRLQTGRLSFALEKELTAKVAEACKAVYNFEHRDVILACTGFPHVNRMLPEILHTGALVINGKVISVK